MSGALAPLLEHLTPISRNFGKPLSFNCRKWDLRKKTTSPLGGKLVVVGEQVASPTLDVTELVGCIKTEHSLAELILGFLPEFLVGSWLLVVVLLYG